MNTVGANVPTVSISQDREQYWQQLRLYADIYKNHFDLFVKGYVVYLAIIGATAGFVFRPETNLATRRLLLVLAILASILATIAWATALAWAGSLHARVVDVSSRLDIVPLPVFGPKIILWLGIVGSAIMTGGGVFLLWVVG